MKCLSPIRCLSLQLGAMLLSAPGPSARAAATTVVERLGADHEPAFQFERIERPAADDAAAKAVFRIADGRRDPNGGGLAALNDGRLPDGSDEPTANFFFDAGTDGGRLLVDLGRAIRVARINTYSRHPGSRSPQVYQLFASGGTTADFNPEPARGTNPAACGWAPLASVDTRRADGPPGGQTGVRISGGDGSPLGPFRYLLFDIRRTEDRDQFGNTFFGEIDVVDADAPAPAAIRPDNGEARGEWIETADGTCKAFLDTSQTPDLAEWARREIAPIIRDWYPRVVDLLSSEGFRAPDRFNVVFVNDMPGVADTSGTRIRCAAPWFRRNLKGEARGAFFHEMVHVVQQYGRAPRGSRAPTWLTEGITDYLRFYVFEPETRGAEIPARNVTRVRYDNSYRVTANFLDWLVRTHDKEAIRKLNAAIRKGRYDETIWKTLTGKSASDLNDEWKAELSKNASR